MWANRIFDEMNRLFGPVGFDTVPAPAVAYPPMNVWEDDDAFVIEAEMPGLKLDDIDITVTEGDQLTISGERKPDTADGLVWHTQECGYGSFSRTVTLPAAVDADKVEAKYEAGVLKQTLPKHEAAKPRRITVKAADVPATAGSIE
jgi:HSP20 family protein